MKKHIVTSVLYTVITAVVLGIGYPLAVTGLAHVLFPKQADGSLIYGADGTLVGSRLIGTRAGRITRQPMQRWQRGLRRRCRR